MTSLGGPPFTLTATGALLAARLSGRPATLSFSPKASCAPSRLTSLSLHSSKKYQFYQNPISTSRCSLHINVWRLPAASSSPPQETIFTHSTSRLATKYFPGHAPHQKPIPKSQITPQRGQKRSYSTLLQTQKRHLRQATTIRQRRGGRFLKMRSRK